MSTTPQNLERCQPCAIAAGAVPNCPATGVPFLCHAERGYCPHPNGPLFGDGRRPDDFPATAEAAAEQLVQVQQSNQRRHLEEEGRRLWARLHSFCLSDEARDPAKLAAEVEAIGLEVPCGECRREWGECLAEDPPDPSDPFAWSVRQHNRINLKLGKPQLGVEEARAIHAGGGDRSGVGAVSIGN